MKTVKTTKPETTFRVYRISPELKEASKTARLKSGQTVAAFLSASIRSNLPSIVEGLDLLGIKASTEVGPARFPIDPALLDALREASQQSGVPASELLKASLWLSCGRKTVRRPPRRAKSR